MAAPSGAETILQDLRLSLQGIKIDMFADQGRCEQCDVLDGGWALGKGGLHGARCLL